MIFAPEAHVEERTFGMGEVVGSIPIRSTMQKKAFSQSAILLISRKRITFEGTNTGTVRPEIREDEPH